MRVINKFLLAALGAIVLLATSCEREPARQRITLTDARNPATPPVTNGAPAVLRIGVAAVVSPHDTLRHYRELIDYLGAQLGAPAEMVQRPSYAEMNALVRERHCTAAFVCSYAYVRAHREFGASPLASPMVNSQAVYRAYLIVQREAKFESLRDLAGKRLAYPDPNCNAGRLYPFHRLKQLNLQADGFFAREILTGSYENAIHVVAEGMADAAGVESPLYDWMATQKHPAALKTRIIETSPLFGTPPVIVHPQLDSKFRARLQELFLTLHEHERGREILSHIRVDRFVAPDAKLYEPVFEMAEALRKP